MMAVLTSIGSDSHAARQAAAWLAANRATYARQFAQIQPQLNLLQLLLKD